MSSHETLYESSDHSPTEHDPNSLQYDFCPQVQSLGLPMCEELRKVASRCEGGEEELIDLTNCLLALLKRLDNEIGWKEKLENSIATSKGEIEQLMMQIGRLKEEREEVEAKASDLEADFEEERKKMMTKITLLERKSTEFDQIIADLSNTITQNENEFKSRISEVNIRYQQLQETHRDYVERTEDELMKVRSTATNNGEVSLAIEIKEIIQRQEVEKVRTIPIDSQPPLNKEGNQNQKNSEYLDEIDQSNNFLSSYNLILMFAFTTMTVIPSMLSTSNGTSWEEIFKSVMDPFLMPPTFMPPI